MGARLAEKVLLIGWDAADWRVITPLLEAGLMPHLDGLIARGAMGDIETLQPMLSPMLWTSIATGKRGDRHGILGFVEADPSGGPARPISSRSRRGKALWNILTQSGLRAHAVGWYASHPAEPIAGVCVSDAFVAPGTAPGRLAPMPSGSVHPPGLEATFAALRLDPADLDPAMLLPFVPEAARVDQGRDRRLATLATIIAEAASYHAAATWILEHEPWDFLGLYLDAIDDVGHHFMRYAPPRMGCVSEEDHALYKDVVDGMYRFHDLMLGRLLELAGPEATVILVSDHGFKSGAARPEEPEGHPAHDPMGWHRPQGIVLLAGPSIRRDELIHGATLLDVTPTVLTLLGLPVGDDMPGRPLLAAIEAAVAPDRTASWDDVPGEAGLHPPGAAEPSWEDAEVLRQLADLGYIDRAVALGAAEAGRIRAAEVLVEARVLLDAGRPGEALAVVDGLAATHPHDPGRLALAAYLNLRLGRVAEGHRLAERLTGRADPRGGRPAATLLMSHVKIAEGRLEEAVADLAEAERIAPRAPELPGQIGAAYLRMGRLDDAERSFARALELDDSHVASHAGLACVHLRRGHHRRAAEAALTAVGLSHHFPAGHFLLGVALARMGRLDRAIQALEACAVMDPNHREAHRWLAAVHARSGDVARASVHHRLAMGGAA